MKNGSSWYLTEMTSSTHSPFDTCGKRFSSGMGPQSILKEISYMVENSGFLYLPSFSLSGFTFLIHIIRIEKKVAKDTKTRHEKTRATYFGDKCSILALFNTLMVFSVFMTSYENQWDFRKFHVSFAAEILNIQELYGELNKIWKNN